MAAMERLVELGKIRFIGVSNFSAVELRKAQAVLSKNRILSNQVRYSLVERTIERDVLPYCKQNQISVISACWPRGYRTSSGGTCETGMART
jgi:aryl-alcohol dehydrogenase-like predicted oxidoreductase